jgi:tetratricopeptide (TPR) repeat protein
MIAAAVLGALAALAQGSRPSSLAAADALERAGDLPGAARAVETALRDAPDDVELLLRAGLLRARSDAFDEAEAHLARAVARSPANRDAWLALGEARFRAKQFALSLAAFEKARAFGDADGRASNGIGSVQYALGDFAAARDAFQVAARNPRLPAPQHHLGRIALDEGRVDEAIERFRRCVALDSLDAESFFRLGLALRARGDTADAIEAFRAAVSADPIHLGARQNLGQTLRAAGREDEGRAELEAHAKVVRGRQRLTLASESLKLEPSSPRSRVAVADALLDLGVAGEALMHYREALRSPKVPRSALLGAARACAALGDAKAAREFALRAIEVAGDDSAIAAEARSLIEATTSRPESRR